MKMKKKRKDKNENAKYFDYILLDHFYDLCYTEQQAKSTISKYSTPPLSLLTHKPLNSKADITRTDTKVLLSNNLSTNAALTSTKSFKIESKINALLTTIIKTSVSPTPLQIIFTTIPTPKPPTTITSTIPQNKTATNIILSNRQQTEYYKQQSTRAWLTFNSKTTESSNRKYIPKTTSTLFSSYKPQQTVKTENMMTAGKTKNIRTATKQKLTVTNFQYVYQSVTLLSNHQSEALITDVGYILTTTKLVSVLPSSYSSSLSYFSEKLQTNSIAKHTLLTVKLVSLYIENLLPRIANSSSALVKKNYLKLPISLSELKVKFPPEMNKNVITYVAFIAIIIILLKIVMFVSIRKYLKSFKSSKYIKADEELNNNRFENINSDTSTLLPQSNTTNNIDVFNTDFIKSRVSKENIINTDDDNKNKQDEDIYNTICALNTALANINAKTNRETDSTANNQENTNVTNQTTQQNTNQQTRPENEKFCQNCSKNEQNREFDERNRMWDKRYNCSNGRYRNRCECCGVYYHKYKCPIQKRYH